MRVNHTGEVCAQALYSGQAMVARDPAIRSALITAAAEERDHLAWCRDRLSDLQSRPSVLDPLWYAGSFAWGLASGLAGDRWSLGFLAETEAQVERHLDGHLERLPADDGCSRAIVAQMRDDENRHGETGRALGAVELPYGVRRAMRVASNVMTRTAYWV
jgi:ubiquinone biosynthesis monooxygenase Coq7